jgi:large subunit ribosomal protein L10
VDRGEKKQCVASLADVFKTTSVVVVARYSGLNVAQMQALRKQMRAAGAQVQVAKNRLVKIAVQGTEATSISELMRGSCGSLALYYSAPFTLGLFLS